MCLAAQAILAGDLVEKHDCFTIAELLLYEVMRFAEPRGVSRGIAEGAMHPRCETTGQRIRGIEVQESSDRSHR